MDIITMIKDALTTISIAHTLKWPMLAFRGISTPIQCFNAIIFLIIMLHADIYEVNNIYLSIFRLTCIDEAYEFYCNKEDYLTYLSIAYF